MLDIVVKNARLTATLCVSSALWACAEERPPPSVDEFMQNRVLLDATMVRCGQNRSSSKYEAECVNAREAINRMARAEDKDRRAELEAQSERKRRALRRAQEAAAQARRRTAEARRRREEAAYLSQFDSTTPDDTGGGTSQPDAQPPTAATGATPDPAPDQSDAVVETQTVVEPTNQPVAEPAPGTDLESIRQELKRRQDGKQ